MGLTLKSDRDSSDYDAMRITALLGESKMFHQNKKSLTRFAQAAVPREAIEAVLGGDSDRFEELFRKYRSFIAGICYRMGVHASDIDDLVSQIFFKIYRSLFRYDPSRSFTNWIAVITANHVRDYFREQAVRKKIFVPLPDRLDPPAQESADVITKREEIEVVHQGLRQLPGRYRDILILKYMEEQTITKIAGILTLPVSTVKTRLFRGRLWLRRILENSAIRARPDQVDGSPCCP